MQCPMPVRRTRAVVDLGCLRKNLAVLSACLSQVGLLPAVKANAYGHGAVEIALECQRYGVVGVCVATLAEAALLREKGFVQRVLLLEDVFPAEVAAAVSLAVDLTVSSAAMAREVSAEAERRSVVQPVHLKVDTGMGRLGVHYREAVSVAEEVLALPGLALAGVYSHFSSADERQLGFSYQQEERFRWFCRQLEDRGIHVPLRHMANSAAILRLANLLREDNAVRPGIAIYGLSPGPGVPLPEGIQPILSLESSILKVARYAEPWPVGYGGSWWAQPGSCVGIVPMGYADGFPRSLSNRAEVLVRGRRVPVVGRVSMDMFAIDLSSLVRAGEDPIEGDTVIIWGRQFYQDASGRVFTDSVSVEEWADLCNTSCYEVVCRLGERVPRCYV